MAKQITDILTDKKNIQTTDLKDLKVEIAAEQKMQPNTEQPVEKKLEPLKEQILEPVIDPLIIKPIKPIEEGIEQLYTFKSVLKNKNSKVIEDLVVAVQYFDYGTLNWVTLGKSATSKGIFKLDYSIKSDLFPTMTLFRLVDNLSLNEKQHKVYQYGGIFSVEKKITKTVITLISNIDFGEIRVIDDSEIKQLPKNVIINIPTDAMDNAVLVGFPVYLEKLTHYLTEEKKESKEIEAEPIIINPNPYAIRMPNLIGLTETACSQSLLSLGLKMDSIYQYFYTENIANGQAIKQSVEAGSYVSRGEVVTLAFTKKS
jgi:hypothetical protein